MNVMDVTKVTIGRRQIARPTCSPNRTMMMQENGMNRLAGAVVALGLLAACEKHDAAAGQAAGALNNVDGQAGQKFDQAANYVGKRGVAAAARANLDGAASATNAAIVNAASGTGAGLPAAGRKLLDWSASSTTGQSVASGASGTSSGSSSSGASSGSAAMSPDPGNARTDMDK
ncbi:MAG: Heat shock protein 60 family co-chaperone GroES [Candidatus Burkholderia crenata]|nr:MAG: Heat shock protein 60 family co-chaperone GroES [Candidatus Burkholderia crenata]